VSKRTAWWLVIPGLLGAAIATQWRDLMRYAGIRELSTGKGHPERVPVEGTTAYPQAPADGEADGTGDFDSSRRGGPAAKR
jgi:hypothetical protein